MLEDVTELGRIEIVRHGRLVAVVLSPREFEAITSGARRRGRQQTHMIAPALAQTARIRQEPRDFDDGWG
jgi:hypothetical protein